MTSRRTILVLLWLSISVLASCGKQFVKSIEEVAVVYTEIVKKFGEEGVHVNVNDIGNLRSISVTFINSALNDRSKDERFKRAQESAEIVKAHYRSIDKVDSIWVTFVKQTTRFGVFHYTEGLDAFGFNRDAVALNLDEFGGREKPFLRREENPLMARALYSGSQNQTDISVGPIQVEGVAGAGVSMIPHFKLRGDANKSQSAAPKAVTIDFASFGPKARFPGLTKVRIVADDRVVFENEEQFSTSPTSDGQVNEFLYLNVSYGTFRKMVAANNVTIVLGDLKYTLDRLEVIALRNMTAYVKS